MVSLTSGPPELMASAAVASPPLADVAFIDADGDAAATDSDASERAEAAGPPSAPPPPPEPEPEPDQTPEPVAASAAGTPLTPAATPLKSALRRGSGRRRLQVVINESRNTYCEAAPATEEAPLLVRALSLRLPEVLSCQPAGAVTLSPPDAYHHMVAAGELFQETVVDDSEGSECSAEGPEAPAGTAPLARLDEDIGLEASVGAVPESAGADDPEADSDRTEERQRLTEHAAETRGGRTSEDELVRSFGEATLEGTEGHVGAATEDAMLEATGSIHVQSDCVATSKDTEEHAEGIAQRQAETASSDDSGPCTPSPEPADRAPPAAWRNLPDLVTDGARAAAEPDTGRRAVLTIANVQQHDKVMEIADSRAEGLLSGILKGGRLWTGGRAGDSEDAGGRSVRFGRPPAPAPRLLLPPATDSDGRSSPSSMDTVIARDGAAPSVPPSAPLLAEQGEPGSDGSEASGDSASLDALRQRALAELALAAGLSRSTRSDVARAIEHNSLRRSLARVSELRLSQASGGPGAAAHDPPARLAVSDSHDSPSSAGGGGRDTTSPPRETPPPPPPLPPGRPGSLFSSPPDIEVPGDVREWKMSETLWPDPVPGPPLAPDPPPVTDPAPAPDPVSTIAPVSNTALVPDTDPVPPVADPVPAPVPVLDPAPAVPPAPAPTPAPAAAAAPAPAPRTPEADRDRAAPRPVTERRPVQRLDSLLSAGPAPSVPGLAASPQPRRPPPEPRRLQFVSPGGREAADSRIQHAAQQLFSQATQQPGSPAGRQTLAPSYRPAAQPLPASELTRQSDERAAQQFVERQPRQQAQHRPQHAPAGRHVRQLSDRFEQQQQLTEAAPADLSRLPQHPAGVRHSAASSADSRDSQESRESKDSRDSYSLDDIDDALAEPAPAVSPSPVKAGSADSGYGSAGGQVGAELDELAAFAEREAARTERLRQRYAAAGEEDGGFARRASVRGIKPRFECTSEILRQLQAGPAPHWSRPRDGADAGHILTVQKDRPTSVIGSTDVLYSPDRSCPDEWRDARRLRYASAQHLPQSRGTGGGGGGGVRPAPAEQWSWGSPLTAPLLDGYVYPEYQPPRQEQPWPAAGAPPIRAGRAPVYRSTPNLYRPPAPARSAPTLPVRQAQQWALYQQQQQQQQQVGWRGQLGPAADQQYRSPPAQPQPSRPFSSSDIYPELGRYPGAGPVPRGYMAGGARPYRPGC